MFSYILYILVNILFTQPTVSPVELEAEMKCDVKTVFPPGWLSVCPLSRWLRSEPFCIKGRSVETTSTFWTCWSSACLWSPSAFSTYLLVLTELVRQRHSADLTSRLFVHHSLKKKNSFLDPWFYIVTGMMRMIWMKSSAFVFAFLGPLLYLWWRFCVFWECSVHSGPLTEPRG